VTAADTLPFAAIVITTLHPVAALSGLCGNAVAPERRADRTGERGAGDPSKNRGN